MSNLSIELPHDLVTRLTDVMDEKELSEVAERSFKRELEEREILARVNRKHPIVEKAYAERENGVKMTHEEAVSRMRSVLGEIRE